MLAPSKATICTNCLPVAVFLIMSSLARNIQIEGISKKVLRLLFASLKEMEVQDLQHLQFRWDRNEEHLFVNITTYLVALL